MATELKATESTDTAPQFTPEFVKQLQDEKSAARLEAKKLEGRLADFEAKKQKEIEEQKAEQGKYKELYEAEKERAKIADKLQAEIESYRVRDEAKLAKLMDLVPDAQKSLIKDSFPLADRIELAESFAAMKVTAQAPAARLPGDNQPQSLQDQYNEAKKSQNLSAMISLKRQLFEAH